MWWSNNLLYHKVRVWTYFKASVVLTRSEMHATAPGNGTSKIQRVRVSCGWRLKRQCYVRKENSTTRTTSRRNKTSNKILEQVVRTHDLWMYPYTETFFSFLLSYLFYSKIKMQWSIILKWDVDKGRRLSCWAMLQEGFIFIFLCKFIMNHFRLLC